MKKILAAFIVSICLMVTGHSQDPAYPAANTLEQIVKAEYYFDNNVEFGNGTAITLSVFDTDIDLQDISIITTSLSEGLHHLYIRTQTADGKWSLTNHKQFYVYSDPPYTNASPLTQIIKAEYYFDNPVAFGSGTSIPITTTDTDIDLQDITIITSGLNEGIHHVYIRTQTADGKWSITNQKQFYVYSDPPYATADPLEQIIKAEYYFDNLIAFGSGIDIPVTINGIDSTLQNIAVNTTDLSEGFHYLYVRTQSANGRWSITNQKQFYVYSDPPYAIAATLEQIVKAEYYFDNPVAFGSGTNIPITTTGIDVDLQDITIITSGLNEGLHKLYIRTQTADGRWGITNQKQFYVYSDPPYTTADPLEQVVKAEYYFDNPVAFGSGTAIPITTAGIDIDLQDITIITSGLNEGFHKLYIRTQTADGRWSITNQKQFYVYSDPSYTTADPLEQVIKAEYYFDIPVAFGSGTAIPVTTAGIDIDLQDIAISTIGLSEGLHHLYIRTQSVDGKWSLTNQKQFYVYNDPPYATANPLPVIIKAEYYFDSNVEFGNGTDIPVTTGATAIDLENIIINTGQLSLGMHYLYVRTQDAAGKWSITNQKEITVIPFQPFVDFQNSEYYIKPGSTLIPSGQTLASFDFGTAPASHAIFNDGIYFPKVDYLGNNVWLRVRHIADDPNGISVGYNVTGTGGSPFQLGGFGGWWGFLYQFDIYRDINVTGTPGYALDGLFPVNAKVESIETLSPPEVISFESINSESSDWRLNSINFSGNNLNSNPGFSATNNTYNSPSAFTALFPAASKNIYLIDKGSYPWYAEFRMSVDNVSQFKYGYEYPDYFGYQGIRLYIGLPARAANDECANAIALTPSLDNSFAATAGTLNDATASNFLDCDHRQYADVWYKFTATAKYHRIVLKNAVRPDSMRFQLYGGDCSAFYTIDCVLNSKDSTVYDATDLNVGETYYIKVYSTNTFTSTGNFDIGIVSPPLSINKALNRLANGSFETPAINVQALGVGNTFNGWENRLGNNMAILREVNYPIIFGPDTASTGQQSVDMFGLDDTLTYNFSVTTTSPVFFSGHFSNQAAQYYTNSYTPWTAFCGILDENNVLVAKSDIMNFTNQLTDKAWYQLSGTVYDLPPGNYKYIAFVSNYGTFDNAFVQSNFNCSLLSGPPASVTTDAINNTICNGANITLTANAAMLLNGGTYAWYEGSCGNAALLGSSSSLTLTPSIGTHTYYVRVEESCGYTTCAGITITVIESPQVYIYSNYGTNNISLCQSTPIAFTAIVYNNGSNEVYQWELNGIAVGSNSPYYTNSTWGLANTVTCSVSNGTCSSISNSIPVNIYTITTSEASLNIGEYNNTYCAGAIAQFYANVSQAGLNPSYQWTKNGSPVGNNNSYYEDYTLITGDVINCSITTDPQCETPILVQSGNSITVTINQPVTPAIAITATNPASSLVNHFTAAINNGGSNPFYEWRKNGIIVGSNQNNYLDLALIAGDIITCTLYSNADCAIGSMVTSNSITVTSITYCIPNTIYGYNPCELAWISNTILGTTINKISGCNGFYSDYTLTDTLKTAAGQIIDFTVTEETDGINYGMYTNIYVDYNQDGDFDDAGEKLTNDIYTYVGGQATGTFTVPLLTVAGSYRMRVILNSNLLDLCELGFGEVEDYVLQVTQPAYCIPVMSNPCDMWISNVTIGTINNSSSHTDCSANGYTDYAAVLSTVAGPGQTVAFSLTGQSTLFFEQWQYADIYIDLNKDGDFDDAGEKVVTDFTFYAGTPYSGSFSIPADQPYGYYRMRVKSYNYYELQTGPCGDNVNGETEDYSLIVTCVPNGSDVVVKGNDIIISDGDITPDITDFTDLGSIVYNTSTTKTFIIENPGTNALNISGVTITGPNAYYFTVTDPPATSIPAGGSTSFTVQFYAGYIYTYQAIMHINTDNCDKKDYDIAIQGTGICPAGGPDINVQGNGIDIARFDWTPSPDDNTDFGTVTANNSLSKTFVIQNAGITDLDIYNVQLFNYDNLLQFDVTAQPASIVAPGGSTSFTISFNAAGLGSRYAFVRINSTDCDESYYDFRIDGMAECPVASPEINVKGNNIDISDGDDSPALVDNTDFGQATASNPVTRSFLIENTGADPLSISGITFTGINAADFSVITFPAAIVAPGSTTNFSIKFLPINSGASSAAMHINNNDCDEGDYNMTLQGSSTCTGMTAAAIITTPILCHGGTGIITITALGGVLPIIYTLNGITNNNGIFTVSAGTDLAYSVTDANSCSAATGTITIEQPAGILPDISLGADYESNFFPNGTIGTAYDIVYNVAEIGGNPAAGDSIRIIKSSGYGFIFDEQAGSVIIQGSTYILDNSRWKFVDTNPAFVYLIFDPSHNNSTGTLGCSQRVYIGMKLKRNTANMSTFSLTARLRKTGGETNQLNNLNSIVFTAE